MFTFPITFTASISASWPWLDSDFTSRVMITILATQVDESLVDYPVYVDLSLLPTEFHTNVNQTDGRDIRITTADALTEVPREVVFYNSTTDTWELHFKWDIDLTTDTDFYIYYWNAAATEPLRDSTYWLENVWKAAYKGVWHMGETSWTVYDSTSNLNHSTSEVLTTQGTAPSLLGTASDFDGIDDNIWFWDILNLGTNDMTISTIVYLDTTWANDYYISKAIAAWQNFRYWAGVMDTSHYAKAFMYGNSWSDAIPSCSTSVSGQWSHLHTTFDRSWNLTVYTNGWDIGVTDISAWDWADFQSNNPFRIGAYTAADNVSTTNEFNGKIDEVRLSWEIQTATWISTEVNNHSSAATFFIIGSEETI